MENRPKEPSADIATPLTEKEAVWFNLAVAGAIILVILVIAGVVLAWADIGDSRRFSERIDVVYKLALFGAGLVTFCTVAWRGLVSVRQVGAQIEATRNQTEQLKIATRQLDIGERNELAKLFQKGVELLYSEKDAERFAGISTLEAVAMEKRNFAMQAFEQIIDRLQISGSDNFHSEEAKHATRSIRTVHETTGATAAKILRFEAKDMRTWREIPGLTAVFYTGGLLRGSRTRLKSLNWFNARFDGTEIRRYAISIEYPLFTACTFRDCAIATSNDLTGGHTFTDCDFSDCIIQGDLHENEFTGENYFLEGHPPVDTLGNPVRDQWLLDQLKVVGERDQKFRRRRTAR